MAALYLFTIRIAIVLGIAVHYVAVRFIRASDA